MSVQQRIEPQPNAFNQRSPQRACTQNVVYNVWTTDGWLAWPSTEENAPQPRWTRWACSRWIDGQNIHFNALLFFNALPTLKHTYARSHLLKTNTTTHVRVKKYFATASPDTQTQSKRRRLSNVQRGASTRHRRPG